VRWISVGGRLGGEESMSFSSLVWAASGEWLGGKRFRGLMVEAWLLVAEEEVEVLWKDGNMVGHCVVQCGTGK